MGTLVFGLTGGIGMGKSTAADLLRALGVRVVDTDGLAREVVTPGSDGLAAVVERFGRDVLFPDGTLDRAKLGQWVFRDPAERSALEAILHPRIQALWRAAVASWRGSGDAVGCVVIPLLFEKDYGGEFDAVVAVGCTRSTRSARIRARGWDEAELARREAAQWTPERKMDAARFVVWTEGCVEVHRRQWERILPRLPARAACGPGVAQRQS